MASGSRRTVITGIGLISPLGFDPESVWQGLAGKKNGIGPITNFDPAGLPTRIGGEIGNFDAKAFIDKKDRKSLRVMARSIQMAVCAAQLALNHSKIDKDKIDPARFGVEFGGGLLSTELEDLGPACKVSVNGRPSVDMKTWGEQGIPAIPPLWMLKYLPNMLACHVSIIHNAQGPNNTITEGDLASLLAIGEGMRVLRRNQADFMLVGGADSRLNPLSMVRLCLFGELSRRNEQPDKACRPFDRNRDGTVIGEGAATFVLEDLEHAQKRGAQIYGELVGFSSAFDPKRQGPGMARAIRAALAQAGITPDDVDHINANGLATGEGDAWEARAIQEVFGSCKRPVPVWAPKSYFGNQSAGSGAAELAGSVLAFVNGQIPATRNFEEPDPRCPIAVTREAQPVSKRHFVKIGYTEMGQCAALVAKKWE